MSMQAEQCFALETARSNISVFANSVPWDDSLLIQVAEFDGNQDLARQPVGCNVICQPTLLKLQRFCW